MIARCIECYTIDELTPEARSRALQMLATTSLPAKEAEREVNADVVRVLSEYGLHLVDGPYYDLDKGEWWLQAVYIGGGIRWKRLQNAIKEQGADASESGLVPGVSLMGTRITVPRAVVTGDNGATIPDLQAKMGRMLTEAAKATEDAARLAWQSAFDNERLAELARREGWLFQEDGSNCPIT